MSRSLRTLLICLGWGFAFSVGPLTSFAQVHVSPPSGVRTISGLVVSDRTGQPLPQARVSIQPVKAAPASGPLAQTTTGADGRFSFQNLPDGKFSLFAAHQGYAASFYDQHPGGISTAIVTGEGLDTSGLRLVLRQLGSIYGTISEDSGDPVPRARILLFRQAGPEGGNRILRVAQTVADAEGNFELRRLFPGTYLACAIGTPWYATQRQVINAASPGQQARSPLDVAYPMTCYPDVTDASLAEAIPVNPGERVPVSILMHAVPTVHITVAAERIADGRGFRIPQLRQEVFGASEFIQPGIGTMQREGPDGSAMTVEFATAPGQYQLEIQSERGEPSRFAAVQATGDGAGLDASAAAAMAEITGKVRMISGQALPQGMALNLVPEHAQILQASNLTHDGTFGIRDVPPGPYTIAAFAPQSGLYVQQLAVNGAAVPGTSVVIGSDPITLNVTLAPALARVSGFAARNGVHASGIFLALVPRRHSGKPIINQSDSDGSFEFTDTAPGDYTLVAVEDGWTLDWARRETFARYLSKGIPVSVQPGARQIALKDAIEVQAR